MKVQKQMRKRNAALALAGSLAIVGFAQCASPVWAQNIDIGKVVGMFGDNGSLTNTLTTQAVTSIFGSTNPSVGQLANFATTNNLISSSTGTNLTSIVASNKATDAQKSAIQVLTGSNSSSSQVSDALKNLGITDTATINKITQSIGVNNAVSSALNKSGLNTAAQSAVLSTVQGMVGAGLSGASIQQFLTQNGISGVNLPAGLGSGTSTPAFQASLGGTNGPGAGQGIDVAVDRNARGEIESIINRPSAYRPFSMQGGNDFMVDGKFTQIVMPRPHADYREAMNGQVYSGFDNQLLDTKRVVSRTAWHMTEPGVAAAFEAAAIESQANIQTNYIAELYRLQQLDAIPHFKQAVGSMYNGCVAKRIGAGKSEMIAMSECRGDRSELANDAPANVQALTQSEFKAGDDVSWNQVKDKGDTSINLWSLLFGSNLSPAALDPVAETVRGNFETYVGNIIFSTGTSTGNGVRNFSVIKTPGVMKTGDYARKKIEDKYNTILSLEAGYCRSNIATAATANTSSNAMGSAIHTASDTENGFWKLGMLEPSLKKISFTGYNTKPKTLMALYDGFKKHQKVDAQPDCDELDPNSGNKFKYSLATLTSNDANVAKQIRDEQRVIYYIAKAIASGEMLSELLIAQEYVNKTVNGTFNDLFVKNAALQLIHEAAGTSDIRNAFNQNLENLGSLLKKLGELHDRASERGGGGLPSSIGSKRDGLS